MAQMVLEMMSPDCPNASDPAAAFSSARRVAGWAVFLAMSWTWCIGMFLPVLLLRDLGLGGFLVFAIPNILGAAAMGWLLRDVSKAANYSPGTAPQAPPSRWSPSSFMSFLPPGSSAFSPGQAPESSSPVFSFASG